ncbi:MAG: Calx-beta domain-containing protein, partial [Chthoniobacteraceae bacterium]
AYVRDSSATTATVTITDDDTPVVTVSVPDATASESGADSGLFLITRTGTTAAALKVYYGLSGSALHGTDYAPLTGEVVIPSGATSAPVVITPNNDDVAEPAETVTLAVTTFNSAYSIGTPFQGTVTISDNADTPLVNVRSGATGTEGGANPTVIFHSIGTGTGSITVNYTVSGTATSGVDFTALSGTISVPVSGSNNTALTIPLLNDITPESTETVVVKITPSANYRIYNEAAAEAVIQDNDSGDRVMVSTYNHSPSEAGPASGAFYFSRTGTAGALTVNYAISGTATNGVDYQTLSGSVVIPDTQSGVDVVMTPNDDAIVEGTETVTLTVLAGAGYGPDRPSSATFEIADNESPLLTVGFQQSAIVTTEQPGPLGEYRDLPVVLSAASPNTLTVGYNSAGGSATGDDVDWAFVDAANGNAVIPGGTLTFLPGVTAQSIRIRIKNDGVAESGETAILQLLGPFNASFTQGRSQVAVTIFDDVIPALVTEERWNSGAVYTNNTWNTVSPDYTAYLGGFTTPQDVADNFSRRLNGQIIAPASGVYNFWVASDDSSRLYLSTNSSAANKVQIASLSGWTSFQNWDANSSQKSANITLVAGQSYYMEVQHQEGGGGDHVSVAWQGPGFARTPIVLTQPDTAPRAVRLATAATTRVETDGSEPLLQVVLDRPAGSAAINVDYSVAGTATNGSDYSLTPGTLTFAAGEQMKAIPLTLLTDAIGEQPESIIVSISNPVGATLALPGTHTITLLDAAVPVVETLFATASSSQSAGTLIATATATPGAGRTIAGWSILSGNTGKAFA